LLIFNPIAGRRRQARLRAVLSSLRAYGTEVTIRETTARGDAERLAREAAGEPFDIVAVAGGDGTINEVINGLDFARSTLAIIPMGTANVLAREIGLPVDATVIARTIASARPRPIHVGRVGDRRFVMMAGVGFDAHVVANIDPVLKRRVGKGAYVWESLVQMVRFGNRRYRIELAGEAHEVGSLVVANGHYYGGDFICSPDARLDLARLDACLFMGSGRINALRYSAALVMGRLSRLPDVRVVPVDRIAVSGPEGEPVQADGDIVAHLPAVISLDPQQLNILTP
jgi:YegS/Rv2252/BmrU family lipid kinase